jgi:hypothetical protein
MKRLLWAIVLLMVILGRASTVAADPGAGRSNSTDLPARLTADGGSYFAAGMRWAVSFWAAAIGVPVPMMKSDTLPPPGITNGSCVDPDGGGRCSH